MSRRLRNMMLSGDGRGGGAVGVQETVNSAITSGGGGGGGGDATSAASDYSSASAIATTASWLSRFLGQHSVFLNLLALSLLLLLSRHTKRRRAPPPSAAHNRHPRRTTSSISPRRISRTLHHEDLPPPPPSPETLIPAGAARSPQQRETHTEAEFGSLPLQSPETLISSGDIVEGATRSPRQRSAMAMAREIHRPAEVGALPPPQEAKTLNFSDGETTSSTQSVETLNFSGGEPPTSSSTQSVETLNFSSGGPTSSSTQTVETLNFTGGEPSSSSTQSVETLNFSDGEPPTYSSTQSVETLNVSDGERPKSSTQSVETLISRSPRQRTMAKSKEARIQEIRGSPGGRYSETLISGEAGSPKAIATENSKQKLIMSRTDQNGGRKMKNSATLLQASRSLVVTREGEGEGGGGRVRVREAVMRGEKIEEIWRQISAGKAAVEAESVKVLHGRISRLDADMALDGPDFKKRVDRFIYKMKRNIIMEARRDAAADNLITAT